jgi:hypothetical protein
MLSFSRRCSEPIASAVLPVCGGAGSVSAEQVNYQTHTSRSRLS